MTRVLVLSMAIALGSPQMVKAQPNQGAAAYLDYDTFWTMSVPPASPPFTTHESRMTIFARLSAQNKADLHVTQVQRWLAANRSRLSPVQLALLDELVAAIPSSYLVPRTPDLEARYADLAARLWRLFTKADAISASSVDGARYLPPTP